VDLGVCKNCGEFEDRCACGKGKVLLSSEDRIKISKFLSGILRHFGKDFGIDIDGDGWARVEDVLRVLKERYGIGKRQLELIVNFDKKGRFEIRNDKIRAKYGHSIAVNTAWSESREIPAKLYHATSPKNVESIVGRGLLPMRRREVHMCATPEEAIEVGKRHSKNPVLIEIDAEGAMRSGIEIRKKGRVYTADNVPPEFLTVVGKKLTRVRLLPAEKPDEEQADLKEHHHRHGNHQLCENVGWCGYGSNNKEGNVDVPSVVSQGLVLHNPISDEEEHHNRKFKDEAEEDEHQGHEVHKL